MKNVSKSPDGRTSPNKLQASRRSPDIENAGTQSSFSSHKTKSNNQSSDGSYYYETRSYTESSSSNSQDLLNRTKDSSFRKYLDLFRIYDVIYQELLCYND